MKFTFSVLKNATAVEVVSGDTTKIIEDQHGRGRIRLGVGTPDDVDRRKLITLLRKVIRTALEHKASLVEVSATDFQFKQTSDISDYELGRLIGENFEMAQYEFRKYKTPPKEGFPEIVSVFVANASKDLVRGVSHGQLIGKEINYARDLANTPGGDMTPTLFAKAITKQFSGTSVKVSVLGESQIKKLKMGLVLGVAKGSSEEPKFVVAEYWGLPVRGTQTGAGKTSKQKPVVLVGKGITFDTGGINLKPSDSLLGMNQDMSGGAYVMAALASITKLKVKKNVVALVPAVENAVSGSAYLPGDVLYSMNGKTVEVLNTDAEGRLVLADALTYAERYSPRLVVDVATLTGAAIVAIGKRASVIMTKDQKLESLLRDLGEKSGDYVWPLPLWREYESDMKGVHADIANVPAAGSSGKSAGGAIQGGIFLAQFASKFPLFAHIDMAPRMESIPEDNLGKGAAGAPVRLLVRLLEEF